MLLITMVKEYCWPLFSRKNAVVKWGGVTIGSDADEEGKPSRKVLAVAHVVTEMLHHLVTSRACKTLPNSLWRNFLWLQLWLPEG